MRSDFSLIDHTLDAILNGRGGDTERFPDIVEFCAVEQKRALRVHAADVKRAAGATSEFLPESIDARTPMQSPIGPATGCVRTTRNGTAVTPGSEAGFVLQLESSRTVSENGGESIMRRAQSGQCGCRRSCDVHVYVQIAIENVFFAFRV